jgi:cytosine/adenosine deaminase-related metal-dependent hydrolase
MRGFLEDLDFRSWIVRLTTAKRAVLSREMLLDSARYGIDEGLKRGITTYADTCDTGVGFHAMQERGVRGIMYQEVFGPDPAQRESSLAELRAKIEVLRPLETALVRIGVSPHAPYTVSDALFAAVAQYARENGLPVAVHIAESALEEELVVHGTGAFADGLRARGIPVAPRARSPIQLLASLGVLDARPLLIHCIRVDDNDRAAIRATHCSVVHCPASNAKLGHGIAPLSALLAARIAVGLGSDSMASNNRMDLLEEARLAVFLQRVDHGTASALSASAALGLATIGGARALGMEKEVGSLEVGKAADLAAFDLRGRGPTVDPESAAVFALAGSYASFTAVAGRPLVRGGRLVHSEPSLDASIQVIADTLRAWVAAGGRAAMP